MKDIFEIDDSIQKPKYVQIVESLTKSIQLGKLKKGDRISSINELSADFLLSRDTVQKAYEILEKQRIIVPVRGKGFYVNRVNIQVPFRILLIFNKISNYKKQIHDAFVQTMGKHALIDLKIHHSNAGILESLVSAAINDYDYFVIMPHFYEDMDHARKVIGSIPASKLLLLDKELNNPITAVASVYQDFRNDILKALLSGIHLLRKYTQLILVFPRLSPYPAEIKTGFRNFCMQEKFEHRIVEEIGVGYVPKLGEAYIVIEETDLVNLIKCIRLTKLKPGKDIGIISYNETPLKEILLDGITVISTDHNQMGISAAQMILTNKMSKCLNTFQMIIRKSL